MAPDRSAPSSDDRTIDERIVRVRDVVLSSADQPTTRREKLARIILDELYEFVGLLDARGSDPGDQPGRAGRRRHPARRHRRRAVLGRPVVGGVARIATRGPRDDPARVGGGVRPARRRGLWARRGQRDDHRRLLAHPDPRQRRSRCVPPARGAQHHRQEAGRGRARPPHRGIAATARSRARARRSEEQLLRQRQP